MTLARRLLGRVFEIAMLFIRTAIGAPRLSVAEPF